MLSAARPVRDSLATRCHLYWFLRANCRALRSSANKQCWAQLCLSALSDPLTNALYAPARRNFTKYDPSHSPSVLSPRWNEKISMDSIKVRFFWYVGSSWVIVVSQWYSTEKRALNWTHDCPPQRLLTAITRPQMEMRKNVPPWKFAASLWSFRQCV